MIKGDFLGFSYSDLSGNLIHSSSLGIMRTSQSNRYQTPLSPTFSDQTTKLTGMDGSLFFGSTHTTFPINITFAYDQLTEEQFRTLRQLFSDKGLHKLILDEWPYKVYTVKPTTPPSLNYICFDEWGEEIDPQSQDYEPVQDLYAPSMRAQGRIRHYKGEGSISFVAYSTYAVSRFKYRDQYTAENLPEWGNFYEENRGDLYYNLDQWIGSVPLLPKTYTSGGVTHTLDTYDNGVIELYNPGDLETDWLLKIKCTLDPLNENEIVLGFNGTPFLTFAPKTLATNDVGFCFDSKLHLVRGLDANGEVSPTIYYRYISGGDFQKIPKDTTGTLTMTITPTNLTVIAAAIEYNYLFY